MKQCFGKKIDIKLNKKLGCWKSEEVIQNHDGDYK